MKYLKKFNTESDYQTFKGGGDYVTPNVCLIEENNTVSFNPIPPPPPSAGDVAYWNGSKVKTTPLSKWSVSLGTPVGVVVVPTGFAPDGKVRIISLYGVDVSGNTTSSNNNMTWSRTHTDTSLTNYTKVPLTDNTGNTSTSSYGYGDLPSDKFTGTTSFVDIKAKYYSTSTSYIIPSPYLGDAPNPEYYKTLSEGNNALSDFNGLGNTETLVGSATTYAAANAAWNYKDGLSGLQWYLPGMGELGYIMPRFNEINATITALGGVVVNSNDNFWSSSECSYRFAYYVNTGSGFVNIANKKDSNCVRSFATID